jgi:outer membrane protein assembly complex protein YaeT
VRLTHLLALAAASVPAVVVAAERQVLVEDVRIEGAQAVHPDRIRFVMTVRPGRSYGAERELPLALADDVRAIERMGPFTSTRTELAYGADPSRVTVLVRVTELPYVARLDFEGLDRAGWTGESDLRKAMDTKLGGYANPLILENDLRAIERLFRDKGHRGATATLRRDPMPGGVALTIVLDLPPAVEVGRVIYKDLPRDMRRRRLDQILDRTQVNRPGNPWQPEMLEIDREDVVRALQDEAWLDARLERVDVERTDFVRPLDERRRNGPEFVPDGAYDDRVHLIYDLDAGERYRLGTVSFVGHSVATSEELAAAFAMEQGAWFRRADVAKAIERARRTISNKGYARCRVVQERRVDLEARIVHLTLRFDEGRPYRVGRVDLRGNLLTRDGVARRAIAIHPGELWNDDAIDESRRQILRTGLFRDDPRRPMSLRPVFPEDRPDEADLVVDLEEESSGSLQVQLGYSSATGVFGQFGYAERNFDLLGALTDPAGRWRGGGQILETDVNWSENRNSVSASWTDPALADGPYSFGFSGSRLETSQRDWDETRITGGVNVGRVFLRNDLRLGLNYGYAHIDVSEVDLDAPSDALEGAYFYNSLGLSLSYDRLDNARMPTSGWLAAVSGNVVGGPLAATDPLAEYTAKGDGFLPVLEAEDGGVTFLRLATRWRAQRPIDGDERVPFYQRYLGGGPAPRHRGFGYNELTPRALNQNGFVSRVGGDRELTATLELSYPVQGYNEGVRTVAFLDAGNVWGEDETVSSDDIRYAWGFGVRFPMQFPISLDFAWLLDPRDGEGTSQVHFGIGQVRF